MQDRGRADDFVAQNIFELRIMHIPHIGKCMTLDDYLRTHCVSGPEFAAKIGVDPATVYRIRKGQVLPHRKTIMAIIQATEGVVGLSDFIAVETFQQSGEPAE